MIWNYNSQIWHCLGQSKKESHSTKWLAGKLMDEIEGHFKVGETKGMSISLHVMAVWCNPGQQSLETF